MYSVLLLAFLIPGLFAAPLDSGEVLATTETLNISSPAYVTCGKYRIPTSEVIVTSNAAMSQLRPAEGWVFCHFSPQASCPDADFGFGEVVLTARPLIGDSSASDFYELDTCDDVASVEDILIPTTTPSPPPIAPKEKGFFETFKQKVAGFFGH